MTITIGLAFVAGLFSFLSPCVFSLIPAYIGYLSGTSIRQVANSEAGITQNRTTLLTFLNGLFFILGFSMVFMTLGAAFSALGGLISIIKPIVAKVGGLFVIIFGLHLTGIVQIPFLNYDVRRHSKINPNMNFGSSFLMGVFFSAGWAPCIGPVLSTILMLALNQSNIQQGIILLAFYSAGLAVPFLIAALGIGWVTFILKRFSKLMHYVEIGTGVVLIVVGILLILGIFERIAQYGQFFNLGL